MQSMVGLHAWCNYFKHNLNKIKHLNCLKIWRYDTASKHCFVGDSNGHITFLKLSETGCEFKTIFNGHEGLI